MDLNRIRECINEMKALVLDALTQTAESDQPSDDLIVLTTLRHVVIPKEYINTMPRRWQADFRALMGDLKDETGYNALRHEFQILKRDHKGRFDEFSDKDAPESTEKPTELF